MPEQAVQHLLTIEPCIDAKHARQIGNQLRLDAPDCQQLGDQGQPTKRTGWQGQGAGGEGGLVGRDLGQRPRARVGVCTRGFTRRRNLADQIQQLATDALRQFGFGFPRIAAGGNVFGFAGHDRLSAFALAAHMQA